MTGIRLFHARPRRQPGCPRSHEPGAGRTLHPWGISLLLAGALALGSWGPGAGVSSAGASSRQESLRQPLLGESTSTAASPGGPADDAAFEARWHDGKAEVDAYRLTVVRYGHARTGRAVLIYVTEPFSLSRHVKVEDPSIQPADVVDVLKLNLVRRFQTGIYDYSTMVSLFARSDDFAPLKVAFSSTEWCGQVYEEMNFDRLAHGIQGLREGPPAEMKSFSYFENESSTRTLDAPAGGIVEDDLFILLRGLRGSFLPPGQRRSVPFLASPFYRRLAHRPPEWTSVAIERLEGTKPVRVPAGTFVSWAYVVKTTDGRTGRFFVEKDAPHRIVRWTWTSAESAPESRSAGEGMDSGELTGSSRLPYWKLHDPVDEKRLRALGLTPAVP